MVICYLFHVAVLSLSMKPAHNHSEELEKDDQDKEMMKKRVDRGGMHKHRMRKAAWIIDQEHQASRKIE